MDFAKAKNCFGLKFKFLKLDEKDIWVLPQIGVSVRLIEYFGNSIFCILAI